MTERSGPVRPSNYLGNYSKGIVTKNPGRNNPGNTNMPGNNNQPVIGSDVMPKYPTDQVSLVPPVPYSYRPTKRQLAARNLRSRKRSKTLEV